MMKNLFFLLFIFITPFLNAQVYDDVIYENPNFFLMYQDENILITNNDQDVVFAGFLGFRSDIQGSVTIKPQSGYKIRITPMGGREALGTGTLIGNRPPLGGRPRVEVILSPNPASSTIQLKSTENIIGYKVYDSQGKQKIANSLLKSKQFSVNVNNLTSGIYHAVIQLDNGQTISKQFIKQ